MLLIRFLIQVPSGQLTQAELNTARGVLEAQYAMGTYHLSFTVYQGGLDATLTFETLTQDTAAARTMAMAVGTALKAIGSRGVIITTTPNVEYTVI